jgi:hypothetical protein
LFLASIASALVALLGLIVVIAPSETATRGDGLLMFVFFIMFGFGLLFASSKVLPEPTPEEKAQQEKRSAEKNAKKRQKTAHRDRSVARAAKKEANAAAAAEARVLVGGEMVKGEWVPDPPRGWPLEPWGRCRAVVEVAGVWYHREPLTKALSGDPLFTSYADRSGATISEPLTLSDDSKNPFSKSGNAVAVFFRGEHIGYLPDEITSTWGPIVRELKSARRVLRVPGDIWGRNAELGEHYNIRVQLPEPDQLKPSNELPSSPHVVIPDGRKRQILKEDEHMDVLAKIVRPGQTNYVAAVLRSITEIRPRSVVESVQVEIDGHRVGILSDTQTKNLLPLVKYIEARGKLPVVRADVNGTVLKAEVSLYCQGAAEVSPEWLEALGPEDTTDAGIIPGPDWDWDDEPEATRASAERQDARNGVGMGAGEELQE